MKNNKALQIFEKAKEKFVDEYPSPVLKIAQNMGIDVYRVDFDKDIDNDILGKILKTNDDKFEIHLNRKNTQDEEIFTIAHEIGHFVKHQQYFNDNDGAIVDYKLHHRKNSKNYNKEQQKLETEANEFAAKLLLPNIDLFGNSFCIANN